jgi:hypothetical protein
MAVTRRRSPAPQSDGCRAGPARPPRQDALSGAGLTAELLRGRPSLDRTLTRARERRGAEPLNHCDGTLITSRPTRTIGQATLSARMTPPEARPTENQGGVRDGEQVRTRLAPSATPVGNGRSAKVASWLACREVWSARVHPTYSEVRHDRWACPGRDPHCSVDETIR